MTAFRYTAVDRSGATSKGTVEAADSAAVREQLRRDALLPVSVEAVAGKDAGGVRAGRFSVPKFGKSINQGQLALVTRQLSTLLINGVRIESALTTIARQIGSSSAAVILFQVRDRLVEGQSLANALAAHPKSFPQAYRASIAAGESSGKLETVLSHLADHVETRQANTRTIGLALVYPAFLGLISIGIVTLLLTFVVPDIVQVYRRREADLPLLTEILITISDILTRNGRAILFLVVTLLIGGWFALRNEGARERIDRFVLKLPLVGRFSRRKTSTQFASTLAMLVISGVPLVRSMQIAGSVVSNRFVRDRIGEAAVLVSEGTNLEIALQRQDCFTAMFIAMVSSGSQSGELGPILLRAAEDQQRELDQEVKTVVALVEPVMLVLMGGMVLMIVMAILMPIVKLNQLTGF